MVKKERKYPQYPRHIINIPRAKQNEYKFSKAFVEYSKKNVVVL